ncbi:hypothetical protein HMH01_12830 [Halovulum dunhuangense]|uniref:DUF2029 domain-containing protein n=1 Tax=Halovulum dunhuangense TaxID=1505036 RepID=A0A849L4Y8_9RHOB|nr:hypothetical protein [Halovulum dunhuangense]NNU81323.1 hypothetical protein [Halovulum dunhuangense]
MADVAQATQMRGRLAEARLPLLGAVAALGVFAAFQFLGVLRAGRFDYPLDDVYIHLTIAREIASGGYGINAGEITSAASSILYPFLLVPFAGTGLHVWMPLAWNLGAVLAAGWLWGLLVARAFHGTAQARRLGIYLTLVGPLAVNVPGAGFAGMEHALHGAVTLAVLVGLVDFLRGGRIGVLLVAGILLGPLLRYEGLAPSLAACGVLALRGRFGAGVMLGAMAVLPVLAFSAFLMSNGLAPLPNSVLAKLSGAGPWADLVEKLSALPGQMLFLATVLCGVLALRRSELRLLALAGAAVGVAHLLFGKFGLADRYEHYAMVFTLGALVAAAAPILSASRLGPVLAFVPLVALTVFYSGGLASRGQWSPAAIHLQQAQMARFARDHAGGAVAVNDIGYVGYSGGVPVLDLWGLASAEALAARRTGAAPGWAGPLAEARGVTVAMVYAEFLSPALPAGWPALGALVLDEDIPPGHVSGRAVTFYATDPADAPRLRAELRSFAAGLPAGATFRFFDPEESVDG